MDFDEKLAATVKRARQKLLNKTIDRAVGDEIDKMAYSISQKYLKEHREDFEKAISKELSRRMTFMAKQAVDWYLNSR